MTESTDTDPIQVTYTATLRYDAEEVAENDLTEDAAMEILESHVANQPGVAGEFSVQRE